MNKGLEIREKKQSKQNRKRNIIKENQKGIIRFIEIEYMTFKRVNGKNRADKIVHGKGLQIENTCYLVSGKRKLLNASKTKILKKYSEIPKWATEELKKRYESQ